MRWKNMFGMLRKPPQDDELKAAARRETERLMATVETQYGTRVELITKKRLDDLEEALRRDYVGYEQ